MENIEKLTSFGVKLAIFVIGDYWPGRLRFHNPPNIPCIRVICRDMGNVTQECSVLSGLFSHYVVSSRPLSDFITLVSTSQLLAGSIVYTTDQIALYTTANEEQFKGNVLEDGLIALNMSNPDCLFLPLAERLVSGDMFQSLQTLRHVDYFSKLETLLSIDSRFCERGNAVSNIFIPPNFPAMFKDNKAVQLLTSLVSRGYSGEMMTDGQIKMWFMLLAFCLRFLSEIGIPDSSHVQFKEKIDKLLKCPQFEIERHLEVDRRLHVNIPPSSCISKLCAWKREILRGRKMIDSLDPKEFRIDNPVLSVFLTLVDRQKSEAVLIFSKFLRDRDYVAFALYAIDKFKKKQCSSTADELMSECSAHLDRINVLDHELAFTIITTENDHLKKNAIELAYNTESLFDCSVVRQALRQTWAGESATKKCIGQYISIICLLAFYLATIYMLKMDTVSPWEYALLLWFVALAIEECRLIRKYYIKRNLGDYLSSIWNYMDIFLVVFYVIASSLRWASHSMNDPTMFDWSIIFYALNIFILFCRPLQLFCLHEVTWKYLGRFMLVFALLMKEICPLIVYFIVIFLGYALTQSFIAFDNGSGSAHVDRFYGAMLPFLNVLGEAKYDELSWALNVSAVDGLHSQPQSRQYVAIILAIVFVIFVQVVVISVFIAIFTAEYRKFTQKEVLYYIQYRFYLLHELKAKSKVPCPLVLFVYIWAFLRFIWLLYKILTCCFFFFCSSFVLDRSPFREMRRGWRRVRLPAAQLPQTGT